MKRVAAQWVIDANGTLYQRHYVDTTADALWDIAPLDKEIAHTIFVNGLLLAFNICGKDLTFCLDLHKETNSCFGSFFESLLPYLTPLNKNSRSLFWIENIDLANKKITFSALVREIPLF